MGAPADISVLVVITVLAGVIGALLIPSRPRRAMPCARETPCLSCDQALSDDSVPSYGADPLHIPIQTGKATRTPPWPVTEDDLCLLLDLLAGLLSGGLALPRALAVISHQTGCVELGRVSGLLLQGIDWDMAWQGVLAESGAVPGRARVCGRLRRVEGLLAPSWKEGTAAAGRLRQTARRIRSDQEDRLSRGGSVLSVRILLPVGLCFLPALVVLGVVPVIASFVAVV